MKDIMETQEIYNAEPLVGGPGPVLIPQKKYYEVINSDIFLDGKLIPQGSIIDSFDPSLANSLSELSDETIKSIPNFFSKINTSSAPKRGRGRPRKI